MQSLIKCPSDLDFFTKDIYFSGEGQPATHVPSTTKIICGIIIESGDSWNTWACTLVDTIAIAGGGDCLQ